MVKDKELEVALAKKAAMDKAAEVELVKLKEKNLRELSNAKLPITAAEAKQIASTSEIVKKRINKIIKEAAEEGMLETNYGIQHPSMTLVETIKADLVARGFEVSIISEKKSTFVQLFITWDK